MSASTLDPITSDGCSIAEEGSSNEKGIVAFVLGFLVLGYPTFVERMTEIDDENQLDQYEEKSADHS